MESTTTAQPFYVGAINQHADTINEHSRESLILKDQAQAIDKMLERDKAKALEQIEIRKDIHSTRDYQLWLVEQVGLHRLLEGKHSQIANSVDDERMVNREQRAQHYVTFIRASYVADLYETMAELYQTALEETL